MNKPQQKQKTESSRPSKPSGDVEVWLSPFQAAQICKLGYGWFHEKIRPKIPEVDCKRQGKKILLHGESVVAELVNFRCSQLEERLTNKEIEIAPDGDEWLLRWRKARALLLELEHHKARGSLVALDFILPMTRKFGERIKMALTTLQQKLRREDADQVAVVVSEALDLAIRDLDQEIVQTTLDQAGDVAGGDGSPTPAPTQGAV
jgi:hypothetical protein